MPLLSRLAAPQQLGCARSRPRTRLTDCAPGRTCIPSLVFICSLRSPATLATLPRLCAPVAPPRVSLCPRWSGWSCPVCASLPRAKLGVLRSALHCLCLPCAAPPCSSALLGSCGAGGGCQGNSMCGSWCVGVSAGEAGRLGRRARADVAGSDFSNYPPLDRPRGANWLGLHFIPRTCASSRAAGLGPRFFSCAGRSCWWVAMAGPDRPAPCSGPLQWPTGWLVEHWARTGLQGCRQRQLRCRTSVGRGRCLTVATCHGASRAALLGSLWRVVAWCGWAGLQGSVGGRVGVLSGVALLQRWQNLAVAVSAASIAGALSQRGAWVWGSHAAGQCKGEGGCWPSSGVCAVKCGACCSMQAGTQVKGTGRSSFGIS